MVKENKWAACSTTWLKTTKKKLKHTNLNGKTNQTQSCQEREYHLNKQMSSNSNSLYFPHVHEHRVDSVQRGSSREPPLSSTAAYVCMPSDTPIMSWSVLWTHEHAGKTHTHTHTLKHLCSPGYSMINARAPILACALWK